MGNKNEITFSEKRFTFALLTISLYFLGLSVFIFGGYIWMFSVLPLGIGTMTLIYFIQTDKEKL